MTGRHAAITGTGATAYSKASGRSVLSLADEAARAAIADAGLTSADIDGVASFMVMHDSVPTVALASSLALPGLRWALDVDLGGQAPCHLVVQAAAAIATGQARHVLVFRAMNGRSGPRVGTMQFHGGGAGYRYPIGYDAYLMYVAMWGQRFLHETGQGPEDLAAVAIAQREHAARNPARDASGAARSRRVPRAAVRGGAVPLARLHRRGRRRLCGRGERARRGP